MQRGLDTLRLSPRDFWAATPRELAAALGQAGEAPMTRNDLEALIRKFPDLP